MFWGLILKSNKKYTQTLEKPFHLTHAALDYSTCGNEPVQIMYTHDDNSYLLCTLQKEKLLQCSLDLSFNEGDKLCFSTKGNGIVHLTGYLLPEDEFDGFDDDEDDMEEDQTADLRQMLAGKKDAKKSKKAVQAESDDEESDDEGQLELDGDDSDDDSEGGEMDDDEDDDEEAEEDSEEEEAAPPKAKQQKIEQNGKKNGAENGQLSKKQQKMEKNQQKENKETKPAATEGQVKKLQGGLMIQDLKAGSGAEAKTGKKIQVYYEGRLKTNNKVFDATKSGPGFKLTLGRGEVIKAWDLGLAGMKVGGKRRITCPPALAYGAKGNPPVIPQNSTLVFDVELKNVF